MTEIKNKIDNLLSRAHAATADTNIGDIENVSSSTFWYVRTRYLTHAIIIVIICIGLAAFFVRRAMSNGAPDAVDALFGFWLPLLILIISYNIVRSRVQKTFMRQFAVANGYNFQEDGDLAGHPGSIFSLGHGGAATNVVSGRYLDRPIQLFNYHYTVGSGRNSHTYFFTVFQVDFPAVLPRLFLHERGNMFAVDGMSVKIPDGQEVHLEGDFDNFFRLTVQKGFEIEALQIFTPDFMEKLRDEWRHTSLEFVGNYIYLYKDLTLSTKKDLLTFYSLVCYIIARLGPVVARIGASVEEVAEAFSRGVN